jgi:shikimate dehydrogenase
MTDTTEMLFGLIGHPVSHSRSPVIHDLFAEQMGIAIRYELYDVLPKNFEKAVRRFAAAGGSGLNVTVPHKLAAFHMADEATPRATIAEAVNTVRIEGRRILGDNTDGAGLVYDLTVNNEIALGDIRILIVGAGGAVRGVLGPLLEQSPREIVIVNRTPERAADLASHFGSLGPVEACGYDTLRAEPFDLVIHATSAGIEGSSPPVPRECVTDGTICYDMFYALTDTPFTRWSREAGSERILQGWGMLIEQAAESFLFWHGQRPDSRAILAEILG